MIYQAVYLYQPKIHILCTMSLVFNNEFHRSVNITSCADVAKTTIKTFNFPSALIPDESSAREFCENYCSRRVLCWGCALSCDGGCKWLAISDCGDTKDTAVAGIQLTAMSQKPGRGNSMVMS